MDLIITQLERKYNDFLDALKKESFPNSYKAIYEYFDMIKNQSDIQRILEQDRKEIADKKEKIYSNKDISEKEKRKIINKIEEYSFSFCYDNIYQKIYSPMKEYRESLLPLSEELSVGRALSSQDKHEGTMTYLAYIYFSWIIGDKEFKKFFWSRIKYKWWLDNFSGHIDILHTAIIKKLVEIDGIFETKKITPDVFYFNQETGQFTFYKKTGMLSPTSKEFKLFKALYNAPNFQLGYNELVKSYKPETNIANKTDKMELGEIIKNIKNKFFILPKNKRINPDIFQNIKKTAYRLNIPTSE